MALKFQLKANKREANGKAVKNLRQNGIIPAVIYGNGFESQSIELDLKEFEKVYTEAGASTLVYLSIGKDEYPTIIVDVQIDPVSDQYQHVDFHKVRLDQKIEADIPLVFIGESPAVKNLGGILVKNIKSLTVEGLPQDLPSEIQVDISSLKNIESSLSVSDLIIPNGISVKVNEKDIVALIQAPMSDEELAASLETKEADIESVEVGEKKEEKTEEEVPAENAEPDIAEKK